MRTALDADASTLDKHETNFVTNIGRDPPEHPGIEKSAP